MNKTIASLSAALLISTTLAGCGANHRGALGNRNGIRPIGYFNGQNNVRYQDRLGYNRSLNNNPNPRIGNRTNYNYNGQQAKGTGHHPRKHAIQARTIAQRVASLKNIENTSVVVTDNDVLVGVKTHDKNIGAIKNSIRKTVQGVVKNKRIYVTANPRMYNRIQNVRNNLNAGGTLNEVSSDVTGIINDLANAAKRPFQNNVR